MPDIKRNFARDFYAVQRTQWQKSLLLFLLLIIFYFFLLGFVTFVFIISLGFIFSGRYLLAGKGLETFLLINLGATIAIAAFHFYDARKHGAAFIRKRLQAGPPDTADRYHKQFQNTIDEIRIAAGLPLVKPYIIPAFAINSMALIEADKSPSIIVTEGMLAEYTRDELQAVIAHELAHIIRGDTFYITLVCSLANIFEKLRQAAEPDEEFSGQPGKSQDAGGGNPLLYAAATISAGIMHLLSTLISRQREILADAAAVELNRNPAALARAIYKAQVKNSFVGDFNLTYSPLFIVPPESKGDSEGFFSRIFNSHPPLMKRIRVLADMVPTTPAKIIEAVWEIHKNREDARDILSSPDETSNEPVPNTQGPDLLEQGIWTARDPKGAWQGPFNLEEILSLRFFTPGILLKNLQEGITATAKEFPEVKAGLRSQYQKKPIDPAKQNKCPRCRISLQDTFYEGVAIKICSQCQGKLIDTAVIERIIARKEVAFSEHLTKKAQEFRETYMWNPVKLKKINWRNSPQIFCPHCGTKMLPRPYTYQYIIPVDKCLSCYKTWFDADELEILQILIESR